MTSGEKCGLEPKANYLLILLKKEFILYGESDGIVLNEYLEKPRLLSTQGDIYMGGINGLLHINRQLPQEENSDPVLNLADVWVGGERMNNNITHRHLEVIESNKPISIKIIAGNKDIFLKADVPFYRTWTGRTNILFLQTGTDIEQLTYRNISNIGLMQHPKRKLDRRLSDIRTVGIAALVQVGLV